MQRQAGAGFIALLAIATMIAGCGVTLSTPLDDPTPFSPATVTAINKAITNWFTEYQAPGVMVGIWIPGKGTYVSAQGKADLATGEAMQIDDHVRVGSITKTFTVTVLLQLVEQNLLGLDDPVSKYVSYIPNGQNITLRMLANMTSGLFSYTEDDGFVNSLLANPQQVWTPSQLLNIAITHPPYFAPGQGFHYSNTNTVLLGVIIEQVTGKDICDVYNEENFTPLGLVNTVCPTSNELPLPYAHGITEQTPTGAVADATNWNPSWAFTAGELISTLQDLKVWVKAYTTGAQISPALQQQRLTWVPESTSTEGYGLGIGYNNGWLGHEGGLPGYNSEAQYLPTEDATIVVLVNSDITHDGNSPAAALFHDLAQVVTPNNVPEL
jgi:D-alanyl-D-alanine carboxypeptidase